MQTKLSVVAALSERVTSEYAQQALLNENLAKGSCADTIAMHGLPRNKHLARSVWKQMAREPFALMVLCDMLEVAPVLDEEQVRFILADPRPKAAEHLFEIGMKYIPAELGMRLIKEGVVTDRLAAAWLGADHKVERVPKELLTEICLIAGWDWETDALRSDHSSPLERALGVLVKSRNTFTHPEGREIFTSRPELGHAALAYATTNADSRLLRAVLGSNLELSSKELRGAFECIRDRLLNDPYLFRYEYSVNEALGCIARNQASETEVAQGARALLGDKFPKVYQGLPKYYGKSKAGALYSRYQSKASGTPRVAPISNMYNNGYVGLHAVVDDPKWELDRISNHQLVDELQPILDRFGVLGWSTFFEMADEWHSSIGELLETVVATLQR